MELWTQVLAQLIVPPGGIVLLGIIGFLLKIRWGALGNVVLGIAVAALFALSLPVTGRALMQPLESPYRPLPPLTPSEAVKQAQAIVVLGAGRYTEAPEYGGTDTVSVHALERLRYAARLARETGLPVLVTGGARYGDAVSEAALMAQVLTRDFGITPRWVEDRARNTRENAEHSRLLLKNDGVTRVYVVTHAWHMTRASWAFQYAGLTATPAPLGYTRLGRDERTILGNLPSARGMQLSSRALHERLGLVWYRWQAYKPASEPAAAKP